MPELNINLLIHAFTDSTRDVAIISPVNLKFVNECAQYDFDLYKRSEYHLGIG